MITVSIRISRMISGGIIMRGVTVFYLPVVQSAGLSDWLNMKHHHQQQQQQQQHQQKLHHSWKWLLEMTMMMMVQVTNPEGREGEKSCFRMGKRSDYSFPMLFLSLSHNKTSPYLLLPLLPSATFFVSPSCCCWDYSWWRWWCCWWEEERRCRRTLSVCLLLMNHHNRKRDNKKLQVLSLSLSRKSIKVPQLLSTSDVEIFFHSPVGYSYWWWWRWWWRWFGGTSDGTIRYLLMLKGKVI